AAPTSGTATLRKAAHRRRKNHQRARRLSPRRLRPRRMKRTAGAPRTSRARAIAHQGSARVGAKPSSRP
ncbi:MAG: hypothetical protein ACP5DC_00850, partial [Halothiobacillaceae bacterium]